MMPHRAKHEQRTQRVPRGGGRGDVPTFETPDLLYDEKHRKGGEPKIIVDHNTILNPSLTYLHSYGGETRARQRR